MTALPDGMTSTAQIEITAPRRFTMGTVFVLTSFGIFRAVPVILAILIVSVLQFGAVTFLLPIAALIASAIVVPFGLGNPYITKLVRDIDPAAAKNPNNFIVQLTLSPRLRSGLRAVLEDADDIGVLSFNDSELSFTGDSVKFTVPRSQISAVQPQNPGLRGFFFYGRRITLVVSGLPKIQALELAERSSWLLPTSRRITKELYQKLTNQ